jgi:hypothetical protein
MACWCCAGWHRWWRSHRSAASSAGSGRAIQRSSLIRKGLRCPARRRSRLRRSSHLGAHPSRQGPHARICSDEGLSREACPCVFRAAQRRHRLLDDGVATAIENLREVRSAAPLITARLNSACQRHTLDFAAVSEPKLHRPRRAGGRINREKFAIYPIHLWHVRNIGQHHMHAHNAVKR